MGDRLGGEKKAPGNSTLLVQHQRVNPGNTIQTSVLNSLYLGIHNLYTHMHALTVNGDVTDLKASERVYGRVWREETEERNIVIIISERSYLSRPSHF